VVMAASGTGIARQRHKKRSGEDLRVGSSH
jgi:hypothetical protein